LALWVASRAAAAPALASSGSPRFVLPCQPSDGSNVRALFAIDAIILPWRRRRGVISGPSTAFFRRRWLVNPTSRRAARSIVLHQAFLPNETEGGVDLGRWQVRDMASRHRKTKMNIGMFTYTRTLAPAHGHPNRSFKSGAPMRTRPPIRRHRQAHPRRGGRSPAWRPGKCRGYHTSHSQ
jgi:hypothetical protein